MYIHTAGILDCSELTMYVHVLQWCTEAFLAYANKAFSLLLGGAWKRGYDAITSIGWNIKLIMKHN